MRALGKVKLVRALGGGLLAALVATTAACAAEPDSEADVDDVVDADGASALVGGEVSKPGQFPSTVFLVERRCTAARVGEKLLLTAAHCVWDAFAAQKNVHSGDAQTFTRTPGGPGTRVVVEHVAVHPSWSAECQKVQCVSNEITAKLDAADVALVRVKDGLEDIPIAPVEVRSVARGDRVVVLGYGCEVGAMSEGPKLDERRLKFAETSVLAAQRTMHPGSPITAAEVPTVEGSYLVTGGPGLVAARAGLCPGDSGGPVYRWRGSKLVVVGVNSNYTFGESDVVGLPVTNLHTRLDTSSKHGVASWLREHGALTQ